MGESFLFRGCYKEPEEEKPMSPSLSSHEQFQQSVRKFFSGKKNRIVGRMINSSLSSLWNLEERENETYILRHFYVTLFLYAASVSLCFFFFSSNSRVTLASPSPARLLRGVQPLQTPITSALRHILVIHCQIWTRASKRSKAISWAGAKLYGVVLLSESPVKRN